MQGEAYGPVAEALRNGDLEAAGLDRPHHMLLEFVETITRHAYRVTDEQVLVFIWGPGTNGKTKFLNAIRGVMGDYAKVEEWSAADPERSLEQA